MCYGVRKRKRRGWPERNTLHRPFNKPVVGVYVLCAPFVRSALGALFILIVLCLCERIQLGIAVIKSAALFVAHTPTVLFVPLVVGIITCVYYVFWIAAAAWTMSTLTEAESEQVKETHKEREKWAVVGHCVCVCLFVCLSVSRGSVSPGAARLSTP